MPRLPARQVCAPALAQHPGHGTPSGPALPEATPAADPFSRLQGGTPHHLTTEQMAQRKVDSPGAEGPAGPLDSEGGVAAAAK